MEGVGGWARVCLSREQYGAGVVYNVCISKVCVGCGGKV